MAQHIDAPLREDVRLLGNLLGETLKAHAGQDLFNQVEQIRALAKGARDGQIEAEKQLEQLFLNLEDKEILPLTRAFTHFHILQRNAFDSEFEADHFPLFSNANRTRDRSWWL